MIDALLRDFRQPEYIHVLINPLPVYGLAMGLIALIIAFFLKSRPAQVVSLIILLITGASSFPVYELGEQAYDRVLSMSDETGHAWLNEHQDRAEDLIWFFYATAILAAVALFAPRKWPRSSTPLVVSTILLSIVTLGCGGYIAYAGGKIRHREFRNVPPPPIKSGQEH
jgi:dolichol kinase